MTAKKRCRYCAVKRNGDIPDDRKEFRIKNVTSIFGREIDVHLMITTDGDVESCLIDKNGRTYSNNYVLKINYCPMCGRRLGGEEE